MITAGRCSYKHTSNKRNGVCIRKLEAKAWNQTWIYLWILTSIGISHFSVTVNKNSVEVLKQVNRKMQFMESWTLIVSYLSTPMTAHLTDITCFISQRVSQWLQRQNKCLAFGLLCAHETDSCTSDRRWWWWLLVRIYSFFPCLPRTIPLQKWLCCFLSLHQK